MINRFLTAILCLGLLTTYFACEKDDTVTKEEQSTEIPIPTIKTMTLDEVSLKFNRLKETFNIEKHFKVKNSGFLQAKSSDDSQIEILTNTIKEITKDNYTSYTMYLKTPDTIVNNFYNIVLEDKNGISSIFISKYAATDYWMNNKDKSFEGLITTYRSANNTNTNTQNLLEEYVEEVIKEDEAIDDNYGGSNSGGSAAWDALNGSAIYPYDCNGQVQVTYFVEPVKCSANVHWPYSPNNASCEADIKATWELRPEYACILDDNGSIDDGSNNATNPNDTNPGNSNIEDPTDTSITAVILPEDCIAIQTTNPNAPCYRSPYEVCRLEGNSVEVCECEAAGGVLEECIFEEQVSINLLTDECAKNIIRNNLVGVTNESVSTNLLNEIREFCFNDSDFTLVFRNSNNVPDNANAATGFDEQSEIDSGIYNITIGVSDTYLNGNPTKLSIALTLIHEMVHAKLMYAYLHDTLLTEYPDYTDLQESLDTFIENRTEENGELVNDTMHIAMVDFIGQMGYALFKYAEAVGMDNVTQQYCNDITKGSFYNTPAMDLINTGDNTAEDLNNLHANEQDNNENALGDDC